MTVIDDNGRLFGHVNIIDALVVLGIIAVFAAGFALVFPGSQASPAPTEITFQTTVPDATADRITPGLQGDHVQITDVHEKRSISVIGDSGSIETQQRVTFTAALPLSSESGESVTRYYWEDGARTRVTIGKTLTLDFGVVVIDGVVTGIGEVAS